MRFSFTISLFSEYPANNGTKGGYIMKPAYFLGSSGKNGFFSLFDSIAPKIEGQYTFYIKGGPGTGKSSFMKIIAEEIESKDIACERIYCSSDPNSLDGIIIPSLRVSIADATSPHTMDPDYPAASGEIINLGECWDKEKLRGKSEEIIELTDKNKACHKRCRRFVDSAFSVYGDGEKICRENLDKRRIERYAARIAARSFKRPSVRIGLEKMRLLDAITPEGYLFLNHTVEEMCVKKTVFEDDFGVAAAVIIGEIRTYAIASGFDVISSPFIGNEKKIRHIIIPQLGLGFFTKDKFCSPAPEGAKYVSLRRFYDSDGMRYSRAKLNFAKKASKELIDEAFSALRSAKEIHDELESIYIDAMDFGKVEEIRKGIQKRIWASDWWPEE